MQSQESRIIVTLLSSALVFLAYSPGEAQRVDWKGRFETESGVKVLINPDKPLFGELILKLHEDLIIGHEEDENYLFYRASDIELDSHENVYVLDSGNHRVQKFDKNGNYLQTIGKKGQGPGDFADTYEMIIDDKDNLYVSGMRVIHVFNNTGVFVRNIVLPINQVNFARCANGTFVLSGFSPSERGFDYAILVIDEEGKILKKVANFPGINYFKRGKGMLFLSHEYSPILYCCSAGDGGTIYGFSPEYRLYHLNQSGDVTLIIKKDEPFHSIGNREKERIVEGIFTRGNGKTPKDAIEMAADFRDYRPFFSGIITDSTGRIFVKKLKSVLDENQEVEFDIFSKGGYYLYKTRLPFAPKHIANGNVYSTSASEETGEIKIRRFKIVNWDQMEAKMKFSSTVCSIGGDRPRLAAERLVIIPMRYLALHKGKTIGRRCTVKHIVGILMVCISLFAGKSEAQTFLNAETDGRRAQQKATIGLKSEFLIGQKRIGEIPTGRGIFALQTKRILRRQG